MLSIFLFGIFLFLPFFDLDPRTPNRVFAYTFIFLGIYKFFIYKKLISNPFSELPYLKRIRFYFYKQQVFLLGFVFVLGVHLSLLLFYHKNSFFLTENDFISMAEILNQTIKGNFFKDVFHTKAGSGNYLAHHFAPSILLFAPFLILDQTRIGYGYGLIFFALLTYLGFYLNIKTYSIKQKFLLWTLFTINIYNYRLFTSYHFEILFLCLALFWNWSIQVKNIFLEIIFFIFLLALKEDISIYFILYSSIFLFKKDFIRFIGYVSICSVYHFIFIPYVQSVLDTSTKVNWLENWKEYGGSYKEIFIFLLQNPKLLMQKFFEKRNVWIDYLGSFGFLNFFHWSSMFSIVGIFLIHILSSRIWYSSLYHYYSYSLLPITWIGVLGAFSKWKLRSFSIYIFLGIGFYFSSLDVHFPLKFPSRNVDVDSVVEAVQKIPRGANVQVSHHLGIFLSRENSLYKLQNQTFLDYILFHPSPFLSYEENHSLEEFLKNAEKNGEISLVFTKNFVKLYRKRKTN